MANELDLSVTIEYLDSEMDDPEVARIVNFIDSVVTKLRIHNKISVSITEMALPLGQVTSLGWFFGINRDPTNFLECRVATAGAKFALVPPLHFVGPLILGAGAQVPYLIADTAACQFEYWLWSR